MIRIQKLIKHEDGSKSEPDNTLGCPSASFRIGNYCVAYRDYVEHIGIGVIITLVMACIILGFGYGLVNKRTLCLHEYTIEEKAIHCPVNAIADHILREGKSNE